MMGRQELITCHQLLLKYLVTNPAGGGLRTLAGRGGCIYPIAVEWYGQLVTVLLTLLLPEIRLLLQAMMDVYRGQGGG